MIDLPPPPKPATVYTMKKPSSVLEDALGAIERDGRIKGLSYKHGTKPLKDPVRPTGMATHHRNIY